MPMRGKFRDSLIIRIKAGDGGAGAVAFHREKYKPTGPPDGGEGGNGGSVFLIADHNLSNLNHIDVNRLYKAGNGLSGGRNLRQGSDGEDIYIKVPVGTVVIEEESKYSIHTFEDHEEKFCVLKGGMGGKGNAHFKSSTNRSPKYSQPGIEGEEKEFRLQLRLIAHIGLVGFPNVGKSTILSKITNAHPRIANYAFTTLTPNLGVLEGEHVQYTVADIPGLIENAHKGAGLGLSFLQHIQKTKIIVYVFEAIDPQPLESYKILQHELESYDPSLLEKARLYVLNKTDLEHEENLEKELKKVFKKDFIKVSAETGEGLEELKKRMMDLAGKYADEQEEDI